MNNYSYIIIVLYSVQIIALLSFLIISGLLNDDEICFKRKSTFFKWIIPFYLPIVYTYKGLINSIKKLKYH